ncbi:MAG: molybdate ABC transporter substrate-binding protein [Limnothrix sp.]
MLWSASFLKAKYWLLWLVGLFILLNIQACSVESRQNKDVITVAIAASLGEVMGEIKMQFEQTYPDIKIQFNTASSGTLQRQIEEQASIDVFASAALEPIQNLVAKKYIQADQVKIFATNKLVLVQSSKQKNQINALQDLANSNIQRIAMGNPKTVPAGHYAKNALRRSPNLYNILKKENKLIFGENVKQVLTYIVTQNVDAGFVYQTDIYSQPDLKLIQVFEADMTGKIQYAIAPLRKTANPEIAATFIEFVTGQKGQTILAKYGFTQPKD